MRIVCISLCKRSVVHSSGYKAISARVIKARGSSHTHPFPRLPFLASSDVDHHRHLLKIGLLVPTGVSVVPRNTRGRWDLEHRCNWQVANRCCCGLVQCWALSGRVPHPLSARHMESTTFYEIYVAEHAKEYGLGVLKLRT